MVNPIQAFMQGVTKVYDTATGKYAYAKGVDGATEVYLKSGTGKQQYIYSINPATTAIDEIHFPVGANITEITFLYTPHAGTNTAGTAQDHVKLLVAIDALSDIEAGNILTGTTHPDSNSNLQHFYEIPQNQFITIPLNSALVNGDNSTGRIDVRNSVSATMNLWVMGN